MVRTDRLLLVVSSLFRRPTIVIFFLCLGQYHVSNVLKSCDGVLLEALSRLSFVIVDTRTSHLNSIYVVVPFVVVHSNVLNALFSYCSLVI